VGWQLIAFIGSCHFGLKGALLGLVGHAGLPYSQKILKLSAEQSQRYGIVAMFPWSIKPVIGMISDIVPIAGYNKRYYMFGASILGASAVLYLATVTLSDNNQSAMSYVAALVMINLQVSVVDLLTEGKYTEKMSAIPEVSSDIVSFVWLVLGVGGVFATIVSFFVLPTKNYRLLFYCAVPFAVQAVFTSWFGVLPEEKKNSSDVNHDLLKKHKPLFVIGSFMAVVCAALAAAQLLTDDMFFELYFTGVCALVLSIAMFFCMPLRLAKATLFLFLTNTTSVSFGSAMQYWFTVDEQCNPGGPRFDYLFFTVYTAIVAQCFGGLGIYLFNAYFSRFRMRQALMISALISSVASIGDLAMVMRWNLQWGIPDKMFYLVGDTILEPIVGMMAFMPGTILISKMCPKNMEATTFAILASFSNLGNALSGSFGVFAMQYAGIKTDMTEGECDFTNLPTLIVVCGMLLPLLAVPLTFILIPDIAMTDPVREDGEDTKGETEQAEGERMGLLGGVTKSD
tara:strand:- start:8929 stop:10464 length:1536 start_codon:yes stop_codon:yes gene_type:complete